MADDLNRMREILSLEAQAKKAIDSLNDASFRLRKLGLEARLSGWDWNRPGSTVSICPQGSVSVLLSNPEERR